MTTIRKIVVTGGKGFLGKNLVSKLVVSGYDVAVLCRSEGVDLLDFPKTTEFLKTQKPDLVIHCAADVGGIAYSAKHPVRIFENNMLMGMNVVKAAHQAGVRNFLNVMPNCTYPGHFDIYREAEFWNGAIHDSVLAYGLPRKALWGLCQAYKKEFGLKSVHLVFPNMYGPGDHMDPVRSHALGALIQKIVTAKRQKLPTIEIWGTGTPVREWIYVEDSAKAIAMTVRKFHDIRPDLINVGVGKGISILDSAKLIADVTGWRGDFVLNRDYPDGAKEKKLDASLFQSLFGWLPDTALEDGIRKTVQWYEASLPAGSE